MSLWSWKRSGWVNLVLSLLLIAAVITSICSTGFRSGFQNLSPNFSFHGGGSYPEVGFFNILVFCSAIFGVLCVILRYSYIMDQIQVMPRSIDYINKISISMGIISFLGLFIITSFSTSLLNEEKTIQALGTYFFIGIGAIFTVLQTVLTYSSTRYSFIFSMRFLLAIILLSSFLTSIVFTEKSIEESSSTNPSNSSNTTNISIISKTQIGTFSSPKQRDLLIACIGDWISVIVYALFFLSFFQEFQTISAYIIMRPFIGSSSNEFRSSSFTVNERI